MARRGDNIHKRKDGRWEGRFSLRDESGRVKQRSVYASNYTDCKNKLNDAIRYARNKRDDPIEALSENIKWKEAAAAWLMYVRKNRKYSTYVKYENIYQRYIYPLWDVSDSPVIWDQVFLERTDISESTKKCICTVLRGISGYAEKNGMKKINIKIEFCKETNKRVEIFDESEQKKLLRYLYENMDVYKMGIVLCMSTGLRLGELCSLQQSDIDYERGILYVNHTVQRITVDGTVKKTSLLETIPKTECSIRQIPLSHELLNLLQKYCKDSVYIFGGNKPMEPRTYQYKFKKYLYEAGIRDRNFHVLRHTFASNCISHGADIKSISEIMGHSDVRITLNRYMHPTIENKRAQINSLSEIYGQFVGQISV